MRQGFVVNSVPCVWAGSGPGWSGRGPDSEGCQAEATAHWVRPGQAQDFFFTARSLSPAFFFLAGASFLKYFSFYNELCASKTMVCSMNSVTFLINTCFYNDLYTVLLCGWVSFFFGASCRAETS